MPNPSEILVNKFPYEPTAGQRQLFQLIDDLLIKADDERAAILLKGYAGTGKTSTVQALVHAMDPPE